MPGVLIPRPDTEILVELALETLSQKKGSNGRVLELGVGSGAVIITLAKTHPDLQFFGTDISMIPLAMALSNAKKATGLSKFKTCCRLMVCSFWSKSQI